MHMVLGSVFSFKEKGRAGAKIKQKRYGTGRVSRERKEIKSVPGPPAGVLSRRQSITLEGLCPLLHSGHFLPRLVLGARGPEGRLMAEVNEYGFRALRTLSEVNEAKPIFLRSKNW